jgi:hypothetical protein
MNLEGFCSINLYKNREFSLQMEGPMKSIEPFEDNYSLFEARNREAELNSVIDGASAILSKNGGHVLSVRSSILSDMQSLKTPRS